MSPECSGKLLKVTNLVLVLLMYIHSSFVFNSD